MKMVLRFVLLFLLFISIFFPLAHRAQASCVTCIGPKVASCPNGTKIDSTQSCTVSGISGRCCITDTGTTGTSNTSTWGSVDGSGPSLFDVSNLLQKNLPPYASNSSAKSIVWFFIIMFIIFAIILSLIFLIWGGFDWITSGGDKQKLAQARQKIMFSIIGLIVVFIAFFIINIIGGIFRVNPLLFLK